MFFADMLVFSLTTLLPLENVMYTTNHNSSNKNIRLMVFGRTLREEIKLRQTVVETKKAEHNRTAYATITSLTIFYEMFS